MTFHYEQFFAMNNFLYTEELSIFREYPDGENY